MAASSESRTPEELARLGADIFNSLRSKLRSEDEGKFVAIDVDTGEFEIDADDYTAVTRLRSRCSDAEIWLERVSQPTAYQMRRHG